MESVDEQLQRAQDMLEGAVNQRNAANNECVTLNAQLRSALRKVADLELELKKSKTEKVAE